jgi:hypothetical protein
LQRGVPGEEEEDDDEDEEDEDVDKAIARRKKRMKERIRSAYTKEQLAQMRFIILTHRRDALMKYMEKKICGDQYGDDVMMFWRNTFSEMVQGVAWNELKKIETMETRLSEAFDRLYALTNAMSKFYGLLEGYENYENEDFPSLLEFLGSQWERLLQKSDEELEIDPEFTRPAVMALLETYQEKCRGDDFDFDYT